MLDLVFFISQTTAPPAQCHPNYEGVCLPIVEDLNCSEIDAKNFRVVGGKDPYQLDSDKDGLACEFDTKKPNNKKETTNGRSEAP